jgi:hypothetical protein
MREQRAPPYANRCLYIRSTKEQGVTVVLYSCLDQGNQKFTFERR